MHFLKDKGFSCYIRRDSLGTVTKVYRGAANDVLMGHAEDDFRTSKGLGCEALLLPEKLLLEPVLGEVVAVFTSDSRRFLSQSVDVTEKISRILFLCHALEMIHKQGVLCTGLRLDCLFIDTEDRVCFINSLPFIGINTSVMDLDYALYQALSPYAAPELLGKISVSAIDHRTDYYAIGVILYEVLTGDVFTYDSAYTPIIGDVGLSPVLLDIVGKLTNRFPQHRYQSMYGITADLSICLAQLQTTGAIAYFLPGMQDRLERFVFKDQLYGRSSHLKTLLSTYDALAGTATVQVVLLRGSPGVGKTALAHYFLTRLRKKDVVPFIAQGKSDQIFDTHYSVIIQILRNLFRDILEDKTYDWQSLLNRELYPYGRLLSTLVPEWLSFFEMQPELPLIDAAKEKQRFHYFLGQFFRCVTEVSGQPLVLFIDDLQWVDSSTLDFLQFLVASGDQSLFVLCTYRDGVSWKNKHLGSFWETCEAGNHFLDLPVAALSENEVATFVLDLFPQATKYDLSLLSQEFFKRTFGNPFFLKQMFLNAWDQNYIFFEKHTQKVVWNLEKIKEIHLDGNIVDLVIDRISLLPKMTQELLKIAAIMGQYFYLEELSLVAGKDPVLVSLSLWAGIQEDFIVESLEGKVLGAETVGDAVSYRYAFLHDRIQSAFYSLVDKAALPELHYRIAKTLKNKKPVSMFSVANHLLAAKSCLQTGDEKKESLLFCLEAGYCAKKASAFEAARLYFKFSSEIAVELGAQLDQKKQFSIQLALAEATYLCGDFEDAVVHFDYARRLCGNDIFQKVTLARIVIAFYTSIETYDKAMAAGVEILNELGVHIPKNPSKIRTFLLCLWARWVLRRKRFVVLTEPAVRDEKHTDVTTILIELSASAYFTNDALYAYVVAVLALFSTKQGNSPNAAFGCLAFVNIISTTFDDFALSRDISFQIMTQRAKDPLDTDPRAYFISAAFVSRFHLSLIETLRYCDKAHQLGLKSGDVIYTNYAIALSVITMLAAGLPLADILDKANRDFSFVQKMKYLDMYYDLVLVQIFVQNLRVVTANPTYFKNDFFEESMDVGRLRLGNHRTADSRYHMLKMQLMYLFEMYDLAMLSGYESDRIILFSYGLITVEEHHFYFGLTLIKNCEKGMSWSMKLRTKRKITHILKRMALWAKTYPPNYRHKYLLLLGEWHRLKGDRTYARVCFKEGVVLAQTHGFINLIALGYELLWRMDHDSEDLKLAYTYYLKWGAVTKAEQLRSKYASVFGV